MQEICRIYGELGTALQPQYPALSLSMRWQAQVTAERNHDDHNTIGYILGYSVGTLFKFSKAKKRTVSIEVGMQNAGLGTNLAMTFFVATNPMAVVPCAISCAWHSISGTILANIFKSMDKRKG